MKIILSVTAVNQEKSFAMTDSKHYVPIVNLSTQYNINYYKNWNWVWKEQLNWININKKLQ